MFIEPKNDFELAVQDSDNLALKKGGFRSSIRKELRMRKNILQRVDRRAFEVSVINCEVISALKNNEDHPYYSERWAEVQRTVIFAVDEVELSETLARKFPAQNGFVVQMVEERSQFCLM